MTTNTTTPKVNIVHKTETIKIASQFVLSASDQAVMVDCSPGPSWDKDGEVMLPVDCRIAMNWDAVERLAHSLNSLLETQKNRVLQFQQNSLSNDERATLPAFRKQA